MFSHNRCPEIETPASHLEHTTPRTPRTIMLGYLATISNITHQLIEAVVQFNKWTWWNFNSDFINYPWCSVPQCNLKLIYQRSDLNITCNSHRYNYMAVPLGSSESPSIFLQLVDWIQIGQDVESTRFLQMTIGWWGNSSESTRILQMTVQGDGKSIQCPLISWTALISANKSRKTNY